MLPARYHDNVASGSAGVDTAGTRKKSHARAKARQIRLPTRIPEQPTPNIPASLPPACVVIGQTQMDQIRQVTKEGVMAINGPHDGLPQYAVPVNIYQQVFGIIDPALFDTALDTILR